MMTTDRVPTREESLVGESATFAWDDAAERLANPEMSRTHWLATVRPDGSPHLMPVIAFWIDGAFHFLAGEGTRKGRNLAADNRCVIGVQSLKLPSLDVIAEGRAQPLTDDAEIRRITEAFQSRNWPLEARGNELFGPNAPSAGPPPYRFYRLVPTRAFGLPGMTGMEQFTPEELPKPTRWEFDDR
jgi:nitroimidazol reductase NimA-like FMN-containing flavoprotein (pyridoxamine 5'-phosphate oxidase superfamily)